jgi:hypothetical protein
MKNWLVLALVFSTLGTCASAHTVPSNEAAKTSHKGQKAIRVGKQCKQQILGYQGLYIPPTKGNGF